MLEKFSNKVKGIVGAGAVAAGALGAGALLNSDSEKTAYTDPSKIEHTYTHPSKTEYSYSQDNSLNGRANTIYSESLMRRGFNRIIIKPTYEVSQNGYEDYTVVFELQLSGGLDSQDKSEAHIIHIPASTSKESREEAILSEISSLLSK